jgi:hypothetical protein
MDFVGGFWVELVVWVIGFGVKLADLLLGFG